MSTDPISGILPVSPLHGCGRCGRVTLPQRDGTYLARCPVCGPAVHETAQAGVYLCGSFTRPHVSYTITETHAQPTCTCLGYAHRVTCAHLAWVRYVWDCGCVIHQSRAAFATLHSPIIPHNSAGVTVATEAA